METTVRQQLEIARTATGNPNFQSLKGVGDDYPMYLVSWTESLEFIVRLNERQSYTNITCFENLLQLY